MNQFTIKDIENLSGVKAHTIRIWETRYHFLKPSRTESNIRRYSSDELKTLLNVAFLNNAGFKVSHIDNMSVSEREKKILELTGDELLKKRVVVKMIESMVDLDAKTFEDVLQAEIEKNGLLSTLTDIVFEFLNRVGVLWQVTHIHPVHEHMVSNIIRQKVIAAIDSTPPPAKGKYSFLLMLPDNEYHELGLLIVYCLLLIAY